VFERFGFCAQLFIGRVGGFDRGPDAALEFVHLDKRGFDFLTTLSTSLNIGDVTSSTRDGELGPSDVVLQLHERAKLASLVNFA